MKYEAVIPRPGGGPPWILKGLDYPDLEVFYEGSSGPIHEWYRYDPDGDFMRCVRRERPTAEQWAAHLERVVDINRGLRRYGIGGRRAER